MSFVLDALRKSEHERQRLTGQTSSILYPVVMDDNRAFRLWMAVIAGAVFAMVLLLSLWWLWPHAAQEPDNFSEPVAAVPVQSAQQAQESPAQSSVKPTAKLAAAPPEKPVVATVGKPVAPVKRAAPVKSAAKPGPAPAPPPAAAVSDDPLKDLPPLEISGYLHDEQTGNLAIINNKLVHEGEEVTPGLVLEKIHGDSAQFNYKGHKFSR